MKKDWEFNVIIGREPSKQAIRNLAFKLLEVYNEIEVEEKAKIKDEGTSMLDEKKAII